MNIQNESACIAPKPSGLTEQIEAICRQAGQVKDCASRIDDKLFTRNEGNAITSCDEPHSIEDTVNNIRCILSGALAIMNQTIEKI